MALSDSTQPASRAPRAEWAEWARAASDAGDWHSALERWDACIAKFGIQKNWQARRGTALLELGWLNAAEQTFRAIANDQPDDPVAFAGLVRVAMHRQNWEGALASLTAYRQEHPEAGSGMLANVLMRLGRVDEARELWSGLVAQEPDNRIFRLMHLRAAIDIARRDDFAPGEQERFLEQIEHVASSSDDAASVVQTFGLFEMIGERRRAGDQLRKAVEIARTFDHVDSCFKAIPRLLDPGQQDQSLDRLLEKVRSQWICGEPLSPRAIDFELRLLLALSRFAEFQERFDLAAEVLPETPDFHQLNLVRARLRKPRHEIFEEEKIFVIGLAKTGTTSVSDALSLLGIDSVHWTNPLTNRLVSDIDIYLFGAASDTCVSSRFEQLYYLYPNAKFIWTRRDTESWQPSFEAHYAREHRAASRAELRALYDSGDAPFGFPSAAIQFAIYLHPQSLGEALLAYEQRVRQFFSDKPSGKLLEFNAFAGEGWPELCGFLGRPIPDRDFPWSNKDPRSGPSPSADCTTG